ncbi:MAG TPA: hypothetical protein VLE73_05245 [Candidatus Saccharimonadales bacterium]|nr:hypothetical protein [Candidatus Saccharimonadales bacterium]
MRAFLHPDLQLRGTTLRDTRLDASYVLTPDAAWVIAQLGRESRTAVLAERIVRLKGISQAEATTAVYSTCGQLGRFGGLDIRLHARDIGPRLFISTRWRVRHPMTLFGYARSMLRAYGWLCSICTGLLLLASVAMGGTYMWSMLLLLGVVASCAVHEAGHAVAAMRMRVPAVLLSSVGYMALMYHRISRRSTQLIALAGPLSVVFVAAIGVMLCDQVLVRVAFLSIAGLHALCLLPICADGNSIWRP